VFGKAAALIATAAALVACATQRALKAQNYLATLGRVDLISYQGTRTDFFGHSYFTSNPQVSSDLIELIRYGKRLGQPGRQLIRTGPVTWRFPVKKTGDGV
jgi:hypothetical protein